MKIWLLAALLVTGVCGFSYVAVQQDLRRSADDPQIRLAQDAAAALAGGAAPQNIIPAGQMIDIGTSAAPFVAVYDDAGMALAWSGTLDGRPPQPPAGIFDYARQKGSDRVTWQPRIDVRQALVVARYSSGSKSGFVASGRSLADVEKREGVIVRLAFAAWLLMLATVAVFATVSERYSLR